MHPSLGVTNSDQSPACYYCTSTFRLAQIGRPRQLTEAVCLINRRRLITSDLRLCPTVGIASHRGFLGRSGMTGPLGGTLDVRDGFLMVGINESASPATSGGWHE